MRQELKFGGTPFVSRRYMSGRQGILARPSAQTFLPLVPGFCCSAGDPVPKMATFLIDILAIRIAPKSCHCIAGVHSNRHSSGPLRLHHSWADSLGTGRSYAADLIGEGSPAMRARRNSPGRCYNPTSALRFEAKRPGRTASHGSGIRKMRISATDFAYITDGKRNVA